MKNRITRFMMGALATIALASTFSAPSAHAVVLEQKWQPGQQLSYDMKLDGTLNLTAPVGVPMIAGMPLEILMKGVGQSTLVTSEVDDFGTATVGMRLEHLQLKMNETTFNQNGVLGIRDGRANFTMNGQAVMPATDVSQYVAPPYGVRITKKLHAVGAAPLRKREAEKPAQPDGDKAPAPGPIRIPLDTMAMVQALMARALPALLPAGDVDAGEEWKASIDWPVPPQMAQPETVKPVGEFTMKAVGEEEILGRKTWRISLDGNLKVDEAQARAIREEVEKGRAENGNEAPAVRGPFGNIAIPKLFALTQKIKGDFWFDPAAGQVVRADLNLTSNAQTRKDEKSKADGKMNYAGNLQLELRKVSYENQ